MRLFLSVYVAAIACGCGAARADPGKIIVDDTNAVDDKRWKPFDGRLQREERVHGEVVVLSPPLFVRGPPKGFPFRVRTRRESHGHRSNHRGLSDQPRDFQVKSRGTFRARRAGTLHDPQDFEVPRTKRATSRLSGRQNRLPDFYQPTLPRNPSYYQPGRIQGEVIVHSSGLSIKGPPKGYPLQRKTRQAPGTPQENQNATNRVKPQSELQATPKPSTISTNQTSKKSNTMQTVSGTSKGAKRTSVASVTSQSSNSTIYSRGGQGIKVKPPKGRHSMMKRLKKMWPYMLIPTMMNLGYAPFVLSSIKMFVMNALMLNFMAFNAAIMLTLRNVVFGPRIGGHTKYVNYGYDRPHHHHGHR